MSGCSAESKLQRARVSMLEITFRRDPANYRPRINKQGSQMDSQQKSMGQFFFVDNDDDIDAMSQAITKAGKKV